MRASKACMSIIPRCEDREVRTGSGGSNPHVRKLESNSVRVEVPRAVTIQRAWARRSQGTSFFVFAKGCVAGAMGTMGSSIKASQLKELSGVWRRPIKANSNSPLQQLASASPSCLRSSLA